MKNLDKDVFEDSSQKIKKLSKKHLKMIVFWTKFVSILGLIASILMFFSNILFVLNRQGSIGESIPYWIISLASFIPLLYLFKLSKSINSFLIDSNEIILQNVIQNLKSYFKSIGITMIILFTLFLIRLIGSFIYYYYYK